MIAKFVIHPAGGMPPARTLITNFVLSLFSGRDMLYVYMIASEASAAKRSEPVWTAIHIIHTKICTSGMLKSTHNKC